MEVKQVSFGEKIKEQRLKLGLSQEALAKELYVSRQAITKWENNESIPDIRTIEEIAKLFKISISYLLDDMPNTFNHNRGIRLGLAFITFMSLLLASLIILLTIDIFDNDKPSKIEDVAFYISLDEEYSFTDLEALKDKKLPYIIIGDSINSIYNFFYDYEKYEILIPKGSFTTLYAYNILYDAEKNEYIKENKSVEHDDVSSTKFMIGDNYIDILVEEPYTSMEVFTYGSDYNVINHEIFEVNSDGRLTSSISGALADEYLLRYNIPNAIQYSIILKNSNDKKIINVLEETSINTFLAAPGSKLNSFGYFTRFIL